MKTIYEKTNTTVSEVLKSMIILPKSVKVIGVEMPKTYKINSKDDLNTLTEYFVRKNKMVRNLQYLTDSKELIVFVK